MLIEGLRSDSLWLVPDVIRVSQLLAALSLLCAVVIFALNERRIKAGNSPLLGTMIPDGEGAQTLDSHDIIETPENQASEQETPPETDEE